ncbi:MAG: hypothetical protein IT440_07135 [Phycisphaeraceae bacterium]|nr:hypothetical protein [Phycisphaeraceae bacterium]
MTDIPMPRYDRILHNSLTETAHAATGFDWESYLAQHDLVCEMPSRCWQDATALGNGSLAALAQEPFHLEWTINKNDVWDYRHPSFSRRHTLEELRALAVDGEAFMRHMAAENGPDVGRYPSPKTCGQLRIRFGLDAAFAPAHRVRKRLRLHDATLVTHLSKHLSEPTVTSFVCAQRDILVVSVRDVSAMVAFVNHAELFRMRDPDLPDADPGADGDTFWLEQRFPDGFRYVLMAQVVPTGGSANQDLFRQTVDAQWWGTVEPSRRIEAKVEGGYATAPVAGDFDLYLTVAAGRGDTDLMAVARGRLDEAVHLGVDALHAEHRRWWAAFWPVSRVGLSDPALEQLWYLSLYHLASTLRGVPVAGLCGLWFGPLDTPSQRLPWNGWYTMDYNAQLPVMPLCRANHPELAEGTFQTVLGMLPGARRNARYLYGFPGACFPVSSDPSGEQLGSAPYRLIHVAGPFWCVMLWQHYLHTGDTDFLETVAYPVLREVATFFDHYLQWDATDGCYHLTASQHPELMRLHPDPMATLALLKLTLQATATACGLLGHDAELAAHCHHILTHYPPYPVDGDLLAPARGLPANFHNQMGSLQALFPCAEFDPESDPELRKRCLREFERLDFWPRSYGCNQGHVVWNANFIYVNATAALRLGLADQAWFYMETLLKLNLKPNGLLSTNGVTLADNALARANLANIPPGECRHCHGDQPLRSAEVMTGRLYEGVTENLDLRDTICPALEGSALYLLLIGETLLQSQNGVLRLFPALPVTQDAEFVDLRVEGPTWVSSQRIGGTVTFVRLRVARALRWKLRNPWPGVPLWRSDGRRLDAAGSQIELNLEAGECLVLAPRPENLAWETLLCPRKDQPAQPRLLRFADGMAAWLGKPCHIAYYAALEQARSGRGGQH